MQKFIVSILIVLVLPSVFFAINVVLPDNKFSVSGRDSNRNAFIQNGDEKKMRAVEIVIKKRKQAIDGSEEYLDADDDFIVYPSQILLRPKEEKVVTIKWVGTQSIEQERPYRFIVTEIPIPDKNAPAPKDGAASVTLLLKFIKSLYVVPEGAEPQLVLDEITSSGNSEAASLGLTFSNVGTAHQLITGLKLNLYSLDDESTGSIDIELGAKAFEMPNVLAGGKSRIFIPWPEKLPFGRVAGKLVSVY